MKNSSFVMLLTRGAITAALVVLLAYPADLLAEAVPDHLVSSQALQQQVENASTLRQNQIAALDGFFSSPVAERAMRDAHINPVQVRTAIPTLSDQELASLSARAADAQQKFSAGFLGIGTICIIIVAIAVIIIVVAVD